MVICQEDKEQLMVKNNYSAWNVDPLGFDEITSDIEKLKYFARFAVLAPSGHNSQPWTITAGKDSITITIDKVRHLSADGSGLLSVEPYISIGTFLETFLLAAKGYGYTLVIKRWPKEDCIAEISMGPSTNPDPKFLSSIINRVSNRNRFKQSTIPLKALDCITKNPFSDLETTVVTKRTDIEFIASKTVIAIKSIMGKPLYRKELSKWVRTNHTRKYDGMPGFTHSFGTLKSLVSKTAVRYMPKHGPQAHKSADLIINSGALIIVSCTNNQRDSFINAGMLYSRICIQATSLGVSTSALGASVIDSDTREEVKKYFKIKSRPVYILRLGMTETTAKHSPRWPLEKILQ